MIAFAIGSLGVWENTSKRLILLNSKTPRSESKMGNYKLGLLWC